MELIGNIKYISFIVNQYYLFRSPFSNFLYYFVNHQPLSLLPLRKYAILLFHSVAVPNSYTSAANLLSSSVLIPIFFQPCFVLRNITDNTETLSSLPIEVYSIFELRRWIQQSPHLESKSLQLQCPLMCYCLCTSLMTLGKEMMSHLNQSEK
jgi:hypothetical protein